MVVICSLGEGGKSVFTGEEIEAFSYCVHFASGMIKSVGRNKGIDYLINSDNTINQILKTLWPDLIRRSSEEFFVYSYADSFLFFLFLFFFTHW